MTYIAVFINSALKYGAVLDSIALREVKKHVEDACASLKVGKTIIANNQELAFAA